MSATKSHSKHASVHRTTKEAVDVTESGPPRMVAVRRSASAPVGLTQSGRHRPAADAKESGPVRTATAAKKA
jgi:hypothetical protein